MVPVDGVKLLPGTEFQAGTRLNYDVPVESVTLPVGTVLPAPMVISQNLRLPAGTVLGAAVTTDSGQTLAAGTVLQQPLVPTGSACQAWVCPWSMPRVPTAGLSARLLSS